MGKLRAILILTALGSFGFSVDAAAVLQTRILIPTPPTPVSPLHRNGAAGQLPNINIIIQPGATTGSSPQFRMQWIGGANLQIGQITVQTNNCYALHADTSSVNKFPFPNNGARNSREFDLLIWVNDPGPTPSSYSAIFTINGAGTTDTLIISGTISRQGNQQGSQQGGQQGGGGQQNTQQQWQQLQQQQLGTRIQGRGSAVILRRRFNPKTGNVEVTMNGIISRSGFLNFQGKDLNRRQALRNYRFR